MVFLKNGIESGLKVHQILQLGTPQAQNPLSSSSKSTSAAVPVRVKWYDTYKGYTYKGYGFVNEFGCSDDIFVHNQTLRDCGYSELTAGDAYTAEIGRNSKEKNVVNIRDWSDAEELDRCSNRTMMQRDMPFLLARANEARAERNQGQGIL